MSRSGHRWGNGVVVKEGGVSIKNRGYSRHLAARIRSAVASIAARALSGGAGPCPCVEAEVLEYNLQKTFLVIDRLPDLKHKQIGQL